MYPTLAAALEYAALGYRVLPLKPGTKVPDLRHWPEEASSDAATIERQFAQSLSRATGTDDNRPNVGIVTGHGLVVVDIDTKHGGERPPWATPTATVRTPSGGLHLYYACPGNVPNSVGRIAPGVDIRGERGQVAAPPSVVPEVGPYAWIDERPLAPMTAAQLTPADLMQDYLGRSVAGFQWRDAVPVGQRNNYLTSLAGYLFASGEDRGDVAFELHAEAERLGFVPRDGEIHSIVRSVARYHR